VSYDISKEDFKELVNIACVGFISTPSKHSVTGRYEWPGTLPMGHAMRAVFKKLGFTMEETK
jgi:hypothetical protein